MVYDADRPELFLKDAMWRRTVGHGQAIAVRSDSTWNVPEPEIGLVLGHRGAILGVTIGNDVSSRDIEGAEPALPAAGEGLRRRVRDRPGDLRADVGRRDLRDPDAHHRRGRAPSSSPARPRRPSCAGVPGARRTGSCATTPFPPGTRAPHRHRPRAARRVLAPARPPRRDPRAPDRDAREPGRRGLDARRAGERPSRSSAELTRRPSDEALATYARRISGVPGTACSTPQ